MLTGRPPFVADTAEQLLRAHLEDAPRPVRSLVFWVPAEIAAACEAALAKDPAGRPASAGALAAQLRAAAQAAQASAAAVSPARSGVDRPAEPTRRLSADQTQVVGEPHKLGSQSHRAKAAAAVVAVLGAAGVAVTLWPTSADRARPVSAAGGHSAGAACPGGLDHGDAGYRARVWTQCRVDGRLAFDGVGTPGEQRSWTARRSLDLVLGNPTGVELVVDGQVLGRPHGHGRLWRGSFRPNRPPPSLG